MKIAVATARRALRTAASAVLALVLAAGCLCATSPAQAAYAAESKSLPDYATWTLQGKWLLMYNPGGKNSAAYTSGTDISVASTGHSFTSVSQTVKVAKDYDSNKSFSFSESWSWSELPSTVPVGKEDTMRVTGSISVGASSAKVAVGPRATFKMRFYIFPIDRNPENSSDKISPVESKDIEALSPFYEHDITVNEYTGNTDFNVGNCVCTVYNWVDANGGGAKGYAGDVTSFGKKSSFVAVPPDDALTITKKIAQKGTHGVLAESAGVQYLMLVTVQCTEAGYSALFYYTTGGKQGAASGTAASKEPVDTVVEKKAENTPGESEGIPLGPIVGGVAAAAVVAVLVKKATGKKGAPDSDDSRTEEQPSSTFQMVTWKDFGDMLYVGAGPQNVGARIEEITPQGAKIDRPDLTARITIRGSENIAVGGAAVKGLYMQAPAEALEIPGQKNYTGIISFVFAGSEGTLTCNTTFKISNTGGLVFAEENLTFVAAAGQTLAMPFGIPAWDANGPEPSFQVSVLTVPSPFVDVHIERDPEVPLLWNVVLTENGSESKLPAGSMEDYTCEVSATLPGQKKPLTGSFTFYRFAEGLRFSVQHLKAFYTVKASEYNREDYNAFAVNVAMAALGAASGMGAVGLGGAVTAQVVGLGMGLDQDDAEIAVMPVEPKNPLVNIGRSSATLSLFTWDEETQQVLNPIPKVDTGAKPGHAPAEGCVAFTFEDVPGSCNLKDKDGNDVQNPCESLQFFAFPTKLNTAADNEIVFSIVPTAGVLTPPNRSQAKVTVSCEFNGRTFTATETVNVISQPYRQDYDLRCAEYEARDNQIMERLGHIQSKIINSTATVERSLDGERIVIRDTYGSMMPVYHRIDAMMEGYDPAFGFYEPDYERIEGLFNAYTTGALGPTAAAECAFYGTAIEDSEALLMTLSTFNRSWWTIGARVGLALYTQGASEPFFMAIAAEMQGYEAMLRSIDANKTDSMLEHFRVGCSEAAKSALVDYALGKTMEYGFVAGAAAAKSLSKTAASAKVALAQRLAKGFSTAAEGAKIGAASKAVGGQVDDAARAARELIERFGGSADESLGAIERDIAYNLGRIEGKVKIGNFAEALKDWNKMSVFQQRGVVMAIQQDKHAMRAFMEMEGEVAKQLRAQFNAVMADIESKSLQQARVALSNELKLPMDQIRVKSTSGNLADDVISGAKLPMDMDATFQMLKDGKWVDVPEHLGQRCFDRSAYKVVHGFEAADDAAAAAFGKASDFSIVDWKSLESYGTYQDALRVIQKSRAGELFDDAAQVGKTAEYKCAHWYALSKDALGKAEAKLVESNALYAKGAAEDATALMREAQALFSASEAFAEEGSRQFVKQYDRIVLNKLGVLEKMGVKVDLGKFQQSAEVIRQMGIGKNGGKGLTTVECETVLKKGLGTDLTQVFNELNNQTIHLNDLISQAKK